MTESTHKLEREDTMRELKFRLERNIKRAAFDVQLFEDGAWKDLGPMTPEKIHNLMRSEINRALQSLD